MFVNDAKPIDVDARLIRHGAYGYDKPSRYLMLWGPLLQRIVSQTGTRLLTGKYHDQECGILVSEGGAQLVDVGELAMCDRFCKLHSGPRGIERDNIEDKMATIITKVVLSFDPMEPVESMVKAGAAAIGVDELELVAVISKSRSGGPFGGNALDSFFDRITEFRPRDEIWKELRPYRRFTLLKSGERDEAEVDEMFADEDLGESLLERMNAKAKQHGGWNQFYCCKPRRMDGELRFWVNGSSERLGLKIGWRSQQEIERWLQE